MDKKILQVHDLDPKKKMVYKILAGKKLDYNVTSKDELLREVQEASKKSVTKIETMKDLLLVIHALERDNQVMITDDDEVLFLNS